MAFIHLAEAFHRRPTAVIHGGLCPNGNDLESCRALSMTLVEILSISAWASKDVGCSSTGSGVSWKKMSWENGEGSWGCGAGRWGNCSLTEFGRCDVSRGRSIMGGTHRSSRISEKMPLSATEFERTGARQDGFKASRANRYVNIYLLPLPTPPTWPEMFDGERPIANFSLQPSQDCSQENLIAICSVYLSSYGISCFLKKRLFTLSQRMQELYQNNPHLEASLTYIRATWFLLLSHPPSSRFG